MADLPRSSPIGRLRSAYRVTREYTTLLLARTSLANYSIAALDNDEGGFAIMAYEPGHSNPVCAGSHPNASREIQRTTNNPTVPLNYVCARLLLVLPMMAGCAAQRAAEQQAAYNKAVTPCFAQYPGKLQHTVKLNQCFNAAEGVAADGRRSGAYRFIVPATPGKSANVDLAMARLTGSSVVGRPHASVAHTPDYYKIQGVDLSHYNGDVDFVKLQSAGLRFAYLQATHGSRHKDAFFLKYLSDASEAGIAIGAYHFFDSCLPAEPQFQAIKSMLPDGKSLLPFAIDVEEVSRNCGDLATIRSELKKLLASVENYYKKRPIIYTNSMFLEHYPILDESFDVYPLWLADYRAYARATNPILPGTNPWTIWQVTNNAKFPQLPGKNFDLNVFFGSEAEFKAFASGRGNVALDVSLGKEVAGNLVPRD